ncbi:MFS transporter [Nocardioides sp. MAHUQ-72]|uniref:MFS transporter n=1 Tax=unclassified Nocardioides TaxID=2615069 RepID=UPI0036184798
MRRTPLVLLEAGNLASGVGNGVAIVVLPWLVLDITGSASAAGAVAAATLLPLLVASLFVGTIVDMVGRKRVAILSDVLSGVSVAAIPLLGLLDQLNAAWLIALAVVGAGLDPAGYTAREAMLPGAATAAGWAWDRANAVHEAVFGVAYLLGPGLGGLLIGLVGPQSALWGTAAGFGLAVTCTVLLRVPGSGRPAHHERPGSVWRGTAEGLVFVWRQPLLRDTTLLCCLLVSAYLPFESVILPVHFTALGSPGQLGLVVTAMSGGGVVGSLCHPWFVDRWGRHRVFVISVITACLALLGLAALPPLGAMICLATLTGLFWGPVQPILNLAMQVLTPEPMRGRVIGVITSATYAAGPLGLVLAGPAVDAFGLLATSLTLATIVLAAAFLTLLPKTLLQLDELREPEAEHVVQAAVPTPHPSHVATPPPDPDES